MKKTLFILLLIISAFSTSAQNSINKLRSSLLRYPDSLDIKLKLGTAHQQASNLDTATTLFTEVSKTALQQKDFKAYIQAELKIGRIYSDKGENVAALNHYHNAQNYAERTDDKKMLAHVFKNIGALYISWKKFNDALKYYDQAEKIATSINEAELVADCQNNKGTVYEQQHKYNEALKVYQTALTVYTQKNVPGKISMVLSNLAIVYKFKKDYKASLKYNLQALTLAEKNNDKWIMAATYNNIGSLYYEMGDHPQTIAWCEKSLALAKQINAIEIVETAYETMAIGAAKVGDYKSAYKYQQEYVVNKDKFINVESTKQLSELMVKYESAKKEKVIQEQQFALRQRNMILVIIAVICVAALAIVYQLYTRNKLKQKAALQQAEIEHQALITKGIINAEEKERSRIASELHDGVGQLFSAVKLNLSGLLDRAQLADPAMVALGNKTLDMVDESCKEVRLIAHQMMPGALKKNGLYAAISEFVGKIDSYNLTIKLNARGMDKRLDGNIETVLYRIVQECVNNVIKHASATILDIDLVCDNNNIYVYINDNGKGFDTDDKDKFEGIGLKNIISRVAYLHGAAEISSKQGKGTRIAICIPQA